MSSNGTNCDRIVDSLFETIQADVVTADRIGSVVTESVPSRFYGRLLLVVADVAPDPVDPDAAFDAAVAVEFACLHQYLHAIPMADVSLRPPAATSPYAADAKATLLDGDFLQAHAFTRLFSAAEDPELARACYRRLSRASISCYERRVTTNARTKSTSLAPLAGMAAWIGARLGAADPSTARAVERTARSLGAAIPVHTPTGTTEPADVEVGAAIRTLGRLLDGSDSSVRRFEDLLRETVPSESADCPVNSGGISTPEMGDSFDQT